MTSNKPTLPFDLSSKSPVYTLSSGYTMPIIAYGTFRADPGECGKSIIHAIKAGYRHFDCAHVYGNEKEIGEAFKNAFDEGLVKREDLFITGKLWCSDMDVEVVPKACENTLKDLQLDYLDLYLIHFPVCWKHTGITTPSWGKSELGDTPLIDTWRAMEGLAEKGLCRSIGVSNYPLLLMHDLTTQAKIQPACNQIEAHAYYQRPSLVNYCLSRNICVTAHTPIGGGTLNAESWDSPIPLKDALINEIADAHKKSPAQVLLRLLLQKGIVILPKSSKPHRMAENIDLLDFSLTDDEMKKIEGLDKYVSAKSNPNPISAFLGGADAFSPEGTDIFD